MNRRPPVTTPRREDGYAFRKRLAHPHTGDRRDPQAEPGPDEVTLDPGWSIVTHTNSPQLVTDTAHDLAHYLQVCLGVDVGVRSVDDVTEPRERTVTIATDAQLAGPDRSVDELPGYTVTVASDRVVVAGADARLTAQGCYYLESLLNLRGGPYLTVRTWTRAPAFSKRMTHSGWGLDDFPDGHLAQIAHAGFTAVVVFAAAPDHTPDATTHRRPEPGALGRQQDFNALVDRCERVGLDVYLYAYFHGEDPVHPDEPGAEAFFDRTYGSLFARCPRAKGIILVGESVEFRSRDPRTSGRLRLDPEPTGAPSGKPSPGWWPCSDFPSWVTRVRDACRRHRPDAEIIFWTYNWGWAPERERIDLIMALPTDITLQATFEMFEPVVHDAVTNACVDYTASFVGPGHYFASEAAAAHDRGLRLHAMSNTGGLTWDVGVIGYQPIPFQWARRHAALLRAREEWGLSGLMENHHYGWYPSFVTEIATSAFWTGGPSAEELVTAIARRDFGPGADLAVQAWRDWSDASADYVPTNADQYGPFRIGPSYPLTLFTQPALPVSDEAMFGDLIVKTPYEPDHVGRVPTTAAPRRLVGEIASLERMLRTWRHGTDLLRRATRSAPGHRKPEAERMVVLGEFVGRCVETTIHVKRWWQLRTLLLTTTEVGAAEAVLDQLEQVGVAEERNACATVALVEADSRLGWEPSMGYVGDADHVRWKLDHLRHALEHELPAYRASLRI